MLRLLPVLPILLALAMPSAALAVPQELAHQGELYDADGPVTDSVEFTFRLFDAETDGTEVWSEDRTIDVVDGLYSVLLGAQTPITQVLADEPALWLEITVDGGDPLLPRHPVASAPYAILADTAVNVDGGTVNASSVSVNGTAVVDAGGSWVGPAGSIDWSALDGLPVGLDDGDADTLGGLSCADGDRAVWNDGAGLWECGTSQVGLDRLDVAGATTGDVLTYDAAGIPAWASSSGCTTTVVSEDLAEVDCGGGPMRVRLFPSYLDATSKWRLRADGTLRRVPGTAGVVATAPAGTFTEVGGSNNCEWAISSSGSVEMLSTSHSEPPPAGSYSDVECYTSAYMACALISAGGITCWHTDPSYTPYPLPSVPSGTGYVDFAAYDYATVCALTAAGEVQCVGNADMAANAPTSGGWSHITEQSGFRVVSDTGLWAQWNYNSSATMGVCGGAGPYSEFNGHAVLDSAGTIWGCASTYTPSQQELGYTAPIRRWKDTPGVVLTDGRLYVGGHLSD